MNKKPALQSAGFLILKYSKPAALRINGISTMQAHNLDLKQI